MAQQTPKDEHDELVKSLKSGTHTFDGRSVLEWGEFDGPPAGTISVDATANKPAVLHPYGGKRVVAIQYGGKDGGGGGMLREYAYDPELLKEQPEEAPEPEEVKAEEPASKPSTRK